MLDKHNIFALKTDTLCIFILNLYKNNLLSKRFSQFLTQVCHSLNTKVQHELKQTSQSRLQSKSKSFKFEQLKKNVNQTYRPKNFIVKTK